MKIKIIGLIIMSVFVVTGCTSFTVPKPQGFAEYEKKGKVYRAVSADNVFFKLYSVENTAKGSSGMWQESLLLHLDRKGYRKVSQKTVKTLTGISGEMSEYSYRYYGKKYIYSVTLFVLEDEIFIAESGGVEKNYNLKRESLEQSLKGFRLE